MTNAALFDNLPDELKATTRFVVWHLEEVTNEKGVTRLTKVPYIARRIAYAEETARKASSTKSTSWTSFTTAVETYLQGGWDGIGFMFQGSGYTGGDVDHCIDPETDAIDQRGQRVIDRLQSYTERSFSGDGIHTIIKASMPETGRRFGPVEFYSDGRYFAMTGQHIPGTPVAIEERQDVLNSLIKELDADWKVETQLKKDAALLKLWNGDTSAYDGDASRADLALCNKLKVLCSRDKEQMDRLFRSSKLYRDKWERQDYRDWTLDKALTSDRGPTASSASRTSQEPAHLDAHAFLTEAPLTDVGNAECMELLYGDEFRYCHSRKKWLAWDGNRWKLDTDGEAERATVETVRARRRAAASQIDDPDKARKALSWALGSEAESKRNALLNTARILKTFATRIDQYDREPMIAGVPNGVLDLECGQHRESRREDYITAQLGANWEPSATCPRWLQFLDEVFAGDAELIAFIQRAVGYSLTGDTREQQLFLCIGGGENGKSKFLITLTRLLGEYAANAPFDTFDATNRNDKGNDLAALKGKRLVTVIETEDDRRLGEARVKAVTGQDLITCRFLYGEFFSYLPQFKIWMAMNHKPTINGTDNGIWRRIRIIPFSQSFKGRADLALGEKLLAELPGILNWAVAGLHAWQRDGLGTAKAIDEATNEYRRESDLVSQWLEECTESDIDGRMPAGDAIDSYATWCKRNGYRAPTSRALGRRLAEIGPELRIAMMRSNGVRHYTGVRLVDINSAVSAVSAVDMGNFPSNSLSRGLSQTNGTNGTNGTVFEKKPKSLPRSDMLLIVNRRLALAEQGDGSALTVARTYMAANDAYDWTEQLDKAEQLACIEAVMS
jgi:putative DNA primase/helicase